VGMRADEMGKTGPLRTVCSGQGERAERGGQQSGRADNEGQSRARNNTARDDTPGAVRSWRESVPGENYAPNA
jgi:hypothetical protein